MEVARHGSSFLHTQRPNSIQEPHIHSVEMTCTVTSACYCATVLCMADSLCVLYDLTNDFCQCVVAQSLCRMVGRLDIFVSAEVKATEQGGSTSQEFEGGVRLYDGIPGPDEGHAVNVTSYFDRFWEHGNHTDRVFFVLAKRQDASDESDEG